MDELKVGSRVRELGSTGPYSGKVIEILDTGQVLVVWWSDALKDYEPRRAADVMSPGRLEKYTVAPGSPGPKALRDLLP
jgi:hypothetical protein